MAKADDGKSVTPDRLKGLRNLLLPKLAYVFRGDFEADIIADFAYQIPLGWNGVSFPIYPNYGDVIIAATDVAWEGKQWHYCSPQLMF